MPVCFGWGPRNLIALSLRVNAWPSPKGVARLECCRERGHRDLRHLAICQVDNCESCYQNKCKSDMDLLNLKSFLIN